MNLAELTTCPAIFYILEYRMNPESNLRSQDVVLLLKLLAHPDDEWTYADLGNSLGFSASQAYLSVNRAAGAGLLNYPAPQNTLNRANLREFLIHGVKYAFPVHRGTLTRGIPTAYAAPPLNREIQNSSEPPPVWPSPQGTVRGLELSPLYKTVPQAAQNDPDLYELLALVDAIRDGRARERDLAIKELSKRIGEP